MEDCEYDYIVLGTGLKQCIISGLLSKDGKKVLHIDSNDHYGGESTSLNLTQLFDKFKEGVAPSKKLGKSKLYIVDLCPKFLMACGNLVKTLIHTRVTRYIDFNTVGGSFVFKNGKLYKMPCNPKEVLSSSLMGFFQKRRLKSFLEFAFKYDEDKPETHTDLKQTMRETFEHFGLDENSIVSASHALALEPDDNFLDDPSQKNRILAAFKMYAYSVSRYGNSPFIYPIYGINTLSEGFARLSAVHGGVYMLNTPIDEILYDKDTGNVCGVISNGVTARCSKLLGSPEYFPAESRVVKGKVARWLFILSHPIQGTDNANSCQIILPGSRIRRKSDIYIAVVSSEHKVSPEKKYIASISAVIETEEPKKELQVAKSLLREYDQEFFFTTDYSVPSEKFLNQKNNTFMASSYDATTHFETCTDEVLRLYKEMAGKEFDLHISAEPEDVQKIM